MYVYITNKDTRKHVEKFVIFFKISNMSYSYYCSFFGLHKRRAYVFKELFSVKS